MQLTIQYDWEDLKTPEAREKSRLRGEEMLRVANSTNALLAMCEAAREALGSLEPDALGIGGDGVTHWYIRDELVANLDSEIAKARGDE